MQIKTKEGIMITVPRIRYIGHELDIYRRLLIFGSMEEGTERAVLRPLCSHIDLNSNMSPEDSKDGYLDLKFLVE